MGLLVEWQRRMPFFFGGSMGNVGEGLGSVGLRLFRFRCLTSLKCPRLSKCYKQKLLRSTCRKRSRLSPSNLQGLVPGLVPDIHKE